MLELTASNRSFFDECIQRNCNGGRKRAESVPIDAFVKSVKEIHEPADALRFLSGEAHWLRSRRPRSDQELLAVCKANLSYCFAEKMEKTAILMWQQVWTSIPEEPTP